MRRLNRRRFLFIGLLSFCAITLGGLWQMVRKLLHPVVGTLPPNPQFPAETKPTAPRAFFPPKSPATVKHWEREETAPYHEDKGKTQLVEAQNVEAKQDKNQHGETKYDENKQDEAKRDEIREGEAKRDEIWEGEAKRYEIREDEAKRDKIREDEAKRDKIKRDEKQLWQRPLGKTGVMVSILGLGGGGIIAHSHRQDDAINLINHALDEGINFIDTAPTYGGSATSERHIGMAIKGRRKEVFLATKTLNRTYDGTMGLLEQSLKNLQTDTVDLYQIHGIRDREDAESVFKNNGVLKAMEKLKREGVVRYLGITGHRAPEPLYHALERYPFDCVLMPLNPAEVFFQSFQDGLLPMALEKDIGIIAMKVPAYGRLLRQGGIETMEQALGYVYTLPVSTAIVGISSLEQLKENIRITREFTPYSTTDMKNLQSRARPYQEEANFYKVQW